MHRERGEIVGVGLAGHFEDHELDALRHFGARSEPLSFGPALQHGFGMRIAFVSLFFHVMELVKHEQGFLEALRGGCAANSVVQQFNEGREVVAAEHRAEQFGGFFAADQAAGFFAHGHGGQIGGFDFGGVVHTSGHAVRNHFNQCVAFTGLRVFQLLDQLADLFGREWQRADA